ncbi:hypothetical protein GCM10023196_069680 [Actinoallomurus vinaceus]|uniref:Uncharacterized protein n=1 Tax=Actinoallomurus vinaceus TaxID=1080074 RepID=A0ABP8UIP8_9ACTN
MNLAQRTITGTLASVAVLGTVAAVAPAAGAATTTALKCRTETKTVPVPKYKDPTWDIKVCIGTEKNSETKKTDVVAWIKPMMHANGTSTKGFDFKYPTNHTVIKITLKLNGKTQVVEHRGVGQYVKRYLWSVRGKQPLQLVGIPASAAKKAGTWQAVAELDYDVSNDKRGAYTYTVKSGTLH